MAAELSTLAREIKSRREEMRMSRLQFGELFGVSGTTIQQWEDGVKKPKRTRQRKLATIFELKVEDVRRWDGWFEKGSGDNRLRAVQVSTNPTGSKFVAALNALKPEALMKVDKSERNTIGADYLADVFRAMDIHHFIAITTLTLPPSGFRPDDFPQIIKACYEAMDDGALFAYIMPNDEAVKSLAWYHLEAEWSVAELHKGFERFAQGYDEHLNEMKENGAVSKGGHHPWEWRTGQRTQLFAWEDFPLTPLGRTISLLGESQLGGNNYLRILERHPSAEGELGVTMRSDIGEEQLRRFVTYVIGFHPTENMWTNGTPITWVPRKGDSDIEAAKWFAQEFRNRILGNPGPGPSMGVPRSQ